MFTPCFDYYLFSATLLRDTKTVLKRHDNFIKET